MKQTVASCLTVAMVLGVLSVTARAASLQGGAPHGIGDPLPWSLSTRTLSLQVQREVQAWTSTDQAAGT